MATFSYRSFTHEGKALRGTVEASSLKEAREALREQGLLVAELKEKRRKDKSSLQGDALIAFTLQLAQLLKAGMPLYEALIALEEQYRGERFSKLIAGLANQIKAGKSLSEAMESYPESFHQLYLSMVFAGEASGDLDAALHRLGGLLGRRAKLKKQLTTSLLYPAILALFCLFVIALLLGFVIPSLEGLLEGQHAGGFTRVVFGASSLLRSYWWLLAALIGGGVYGLRRWITTEKGRALLERAQLTLPLLRNVTIATASARTCRTLSTLLHSGVPLVDALTQVSRSMQTKDIAKELESTIQNICAGSSLSKELKKSRYFPDMMARMIGVAEEAGTLPAVLDNLAEMYEEQVERTLQRGVTLAQPVILLVMGAIIGVVMAAILLPMSSIGSM